MQSTPIATSVGMAEAPHGNGSILSPRAALRAHPAEAPIGFAELQSAVWMTFMTPGIFVSS